MPKGKTKYLELRCMPFLDLFTPTQNMYWDSPASFTGMQEICLIKTDEKYCLHN